MRPIITKLLNEIRANMTPEEILELHEVLDTYSGTDELFNGVTEIAMKLHPEIFRRSKFDN